MANRYSTGDFRSTEPVPPAAAQFLQWVHGNPQISAILANPQYAGDAPAQRRARQAAIHRVVVQAGQHIPEGLKINADGKLETDDQTGLPGWAKGLIIGGAATAAVFAGPAILSAFGVGGSEAASGAGAAGTAASLAPLAATTTVPLSTGTIAGLSGGLGTAAGTGAAAGAGAGGLLASTALPTSTGTVAGLSGGTGLGAAGAGAGAGAAGTGASEFVGPTTTGLTDASGAPIVQGANSSALSGVGSWLGGTAGGEVIRAGGILGGAAIQSAANTNAAKIQAQTAAQALAYVKQRDQYLQNLEANRYAQYNARVQPYQDMANTTGDKLAKLLGVNPGSYTYGLPSGASTPPPAIPPSIPSQPPGPTYQTRTGLDTSGPPVGTAIPRPGGPLGTQYGGLVTMRAPDGSLKQVPPEQVSHFQQAGAQVVSANG